MTEAAQVAGGAALVDAAERIRHKAEEALAQACRLRDTLWGPRPEATRPDKAPIAPAGVMGRVLSLLAEADLMCGVTNEVLGGLNAEFPRDERLTPGPAPRLGAYLPRLATGAESMTETRPRAPPI